MIKVENRLHTVSETRKNYVPIGATTWQKFIQEGRVPTIHLGHRRYITPSTIEAILSGELSFELEKK